MSEVSDIILHMKNYLCVILVCEILNEHSSVYECHILEIYI